MKKEKRKNYAKQPDVEPPLRHWAGLIQGNERDFFSMSESSKAGHTKAVQVMKTGLDSEVPVHPNVLDGVEVRVR